MPKFKIEQVAFCPVDPERAIAFLKKVGMEEWIKDHVVANGKVFNADGRNEADLAFNYTALGDARELEVLHYTEGPNWMSGFRSNSVSHIGMHVTAEELVEWRKFFEAEGIAIAQEVFTESHTNKFLLECGRKYNYCIFDTRDIIGVDMKFICRIEKE